MENRRNDKRLLLPDLQVQVKKQGRGDSSSYIECTPIDISFNGLAFSSDELELELLQKVDLQLTAGHRTLRGSAVICHVGKTAKGIRYGVLYIDLNPSLEQLFSLDNLTSPQVIELATSLADNVLIDKNLTEEQQNLEKAKSLLFDAVTAFKNRICQRLENKTDTQGNTCQVASLFEFSTDNSSVAIPLKSTNEDAVTRCMVTPDIDSSKNRIYFRTDDGRQFATLMEFMQELSETFELLFSQNT